MPIREYWLILWRRKWVFIITTTITLAVAIVGTWLTQPIYSAATTLRVATSYAGTTNSYIVDYVDRLLNTYIKLVTSRPVISELEQRIGINYRPQINAQVVSNTELIKITVESPDPNLAANAANTLADILMSQVATPDTGDVKTSALNAQLAQIESDLSQAQIEYDNLLATSPADSERLQGLKNEIQLKQGIYATLLQQREQSLLLDAIQSKAISIVEPAIVPRTPVKPRVMLNIVLGMILGVCGGIGLAFLFENLDTTLYTTEQIEKVTQLPSLGKIPSLNGHKRTVLSDGNSTYREAYRRLRTNVLRQDIDSRCRTLLVTSSVPKEGKSTITANLAISLAQSGNKVVIIDCDMHIPAQHKIFSLPNTKGLSNVLQKRINFETILQDDSTPGLWILTTGPIPHNPAELLNSAEMIQLIEALRQRYDVILLDAPAILGVADAAILAPIADMAILVVGRGRSRRDVVRMSCQQLVEAKAKKIGIVINRSEQTGSYYYYNKIKPKPIVPKKT